MSRRNVLIAAVAGVAVLAGASIMWPNPATAIGTVLAAVAAVVFGVGGHELRAVFFKPVLKVSIELKAPDSILIQTQVTNPMTGQLLGYLPTFYYRLRIVNTGNATAREIEVRVLDLRRRNPTGHFVTDPSFLPLNLTWSHVGGVVLPSIHSGLFHNCDLLHVVENNGLSQSAYPDPTQFMFNTQVQPTPVGPGVWPTLKPVGVYELDVVAYAANADPVRTTLTIDYRGWFANEGDMFSKGLIVAKKI